nr:putative reverse transcriptase domain-containing protein [Tanacetum cinerariifolium]
MVTNRNNPNDNVPNFKAMIIAVVANALPNLTAALRTQITNDIRNGAGPSGGVVWFEDRLCVPSDQALREKVMTEAHSSPFTVHLGLTKMYRDLKQYF